MSKPGAIIIEGHVQGLSNTRALGEAGIPVYVIDVNTCLAGFSKYCKNFFVCPSFTSPEFIDFLVDLAAKEKLDGWVLIPSNDHIVENLSNNLDRVRKHYKTLVPEPDALKNIIDKGNLTEIARNSNTPVPQTLLYSNLAAMADQLNFPVLIKGRAGLSFYKAMHAKAIQANTKDDLFKFLPGIVENVPVENIMVQELIPWTAEHKVISFTAFCVDGQIKAHWAGIKIREHPVKYGTGTYAMSIYNKSCHRQSISLLAALKYTGVCEVEYLYDPRDGHYKLIEINPRTWLWVGLAKACGVNYALMVYNYLNQIETNYPQNYRLNLGWINYLTDTVFAWKGIFTGQVSFPGYVRSLFRRNVNAVFSWRDPLPGIVFPIMGFYIARKRS